MELTTANTNPLDQVISLINLQKNRKKTHAKANVSEKIIAQCFGSSQKPLFFTQFLVDPLELKKAQKSAVFHFRDQNIYVDSRQIYCDITWSAHKDPNETALEKADMVISLFTNV